MEWGKEAISGRQWIIESGRLAALLLSFVLISPWVFSAISGMQPTVIREFSRSFLSIDFLWQFYPLLVWLSVPIIISSCVASLISFRLYRGGERSESIRKFHLFSSFVGPLLVILVSYWSFNYWIDAAVSFLRQGGDGTNLLVAFRAWLVSLGGGLAVFSIMLWVFNRWLFNRRADRT